MNLLRNRRSALKDTQSNLSAPLQQVIVEESVGDDGKKIRTNHAVDLDLEIFDKLVDFFEKEVKECDEKISELKEQAAQLKNKTGDNTPVSN